jgi:hypothetical protein
MRGISKTLNHLKGASLFQNGWRNEEKKMSSDDLRNKI